MAVSLRVTNAQSHSITNVRQSSVQAQETKLRSSAFAPTASGHTLQRHQRQVEDGAVSPAVAARYWRAIASTNVTMTGHVPRELQLEASGRARSLYQALSQPRRVFSCLTQLAVHRMAQHEGTAAQVAADE